MGMRKCDSCNGWYNQQDKEKHCWTCKELKKDKPDTVYLVYQEKNGHGEVFFVRRNEVDAKADVDFRVKQGIKAWYETRFLQ
ncbi:TPA: hypothetical protein ACGXM3_005296 [Bacillus cereus]